MFNRLTFVLAIIARCSLGASFEPSMEPDWEYMLVAVNWNCTDQDVIDINVRPVRVERGVYALNGTADIRIEIDNSFTFAHQLLYSTTGSGQWSNTPFEVKPTKFYDFMNTIYKDYLNEDLNRCAGMPLFGDEKYEEPLKPTIITINNCLLKTSALPSHLRPGYYKITLVIDGPPGKLYAEAIAKVNQKNS